MTFQEMIETDLHICPVQKLEKSTIANNTIIYFRRFRNIFVKSPRKNLFSKFATKMLQLPSIQILLEMIVPSDDRITRSSFETLLLSLFDDSHLVNMFRSLKWF